MRTEPPNPRLSKIWRISDSIFFPNAESTLTENSIPTLRSSPDRSFGRILVPSLFQTSGGEPVFETQLPLSYRAPRKTRYAAAG